MIHNNSIVMHEDELTEDDLLELPEEELRLHIAGKCGWKRDLVPDSDGQGELEFWEKGGEYSDTLPNYTRDPAAMSEAESILSHDPGSGPAGTTLSQWEWYLAILETLADSAACFADVLFASPLSRAQAFYRVTS